MGILVVYRRGVAGTFWHVHVGLRGGKRSLVLEAVRRGLEKFMAPQSTADPKL